MNYGIMYEKLRKAVHSSMEVAYILMKDRVQIKNNLDFLVELLFTFLGQSPTIMKNNKVRTILYLIHWSWY